MPEAVSSGRNTFRMIANGVGGSDNLLNRHPGFIEIYFHCLLFVAGSNPFNARNLIFKAFKVHGTVGTLHIVDSESYLHIFYSLQLIRWIFTGKVTLSQIGNELTCNLEDFTGSSENQ